MLSIIVIVDNKEKRIGVNQKHICSFSEKYIDDKQCTEIRMSNGDVWNVVTPSYDEWFPDQFTTDTDY